MDLYQSCSTMTVELINYIQAHPNTVLHMDEFLVRYQNAIFNFIRLAIGDYHASADVTNRVLLTLTKKVVEIRVKESFNRLVLKVIRGEIGNYWKTQRSKKAKMLKEATIRHNDEEISLLETIEADTDKAEEILNLLVIRDLIENAPEPYLKEIFCLKYRDDKSISDIASRLNLTEYQVKKHLAAIHRKVENYLEKR